MDRRIGLILLSSVIGFIAWSGHVFALPLCALFPAIWAQTTRRDDAFFVAYAYFLSGSRGLPLGSAAFFNQSILTGVILWWMAGSLFALLFNLLWCKNKRQRVLINLPLILILISIPPLGIAVWGNPLSGAGILFPSAGFSGLFLMLLIIIAISLSTVKVMALCTLCLILPGLIVNNRPALPTEYGWAGIDTHFDYDVDVVDFVKDYNRQQKVMDITLESKAGVLVFPEGITGKWSRATQKMWEVFQPELKEKILLVGTEIPKGTKYENVIMKLTHDTQEVIYKQRMPVPVTMWRPWDDNGALPGWFSDPVFSLNGKKVSALICHEAFITWPIFHSMMHQPEILIVIGSTWWARKTNIPSLQRTLIYAWASLFDVKLITALNT